MADKKKSLKSKVLGEKTPSLGSKIVMGVFVITVALVGFAVAFNLVAGAKTRTLADDNTYQAVFLENGQVYFGRLSGVDDTYIQLTDVYYLQSNQDVQGDDKNTDTSKAEQQPQLQLNKLGNELHGPQNQMFIVRDNVSFWENLKTDSKVVEAIKNQK